jgi:hypothetical protein
VNRSVNEELVLEGLEMGQKGGPFPRKGKKRGLWRTPFKSFAFLREGQKARALGGWYEKL